MSVFLTLSAGDRLRPDVIGQQGESINQFHIFKFFLETIEIDYDLRLFLLRDRGDFRMIYSKSYPAFPHSRRPPSKSVTSSNPSLTSFFAAMGLASHSISLQ